MPLSSLSTPLLLRVFALRFSFVVFPAAASLTPAALAGFVGAAGVSRLVAAIATVRRRFSSFPPLPYVCLAPTSFNPARHFGG